MRKALFAVAGLLLALPGLAFAQFDGSGTITTGGTAQVVALLGLALAQPSVATIVDYICIEP